MVALVDYLMWVVLAYYFYVVFCCCWFMLEYTKRDALEAMDLHSELLHMITFGAFKND